MALFSPDIVEYGDRTGFGWWLDGHQLEHLQFYRVGVTGTPFKFNVPPYDLNGWTWQDREVQTDWLDVHSLIHDIIRGSIGFSGFDLSAVDFNDHNYFEIWMDAHASEHRAIRLALGLGA